MRRGATLLVALVAVGVAQADPNSAPAETAATPAEAAAEPVPDPEAVRVGEDANLESTARRQGIVGGVTAGPSFTIGGGTGTGGTVAFRLGAVATPRTVIGVELVGSGQVRRVSLGPGMNELRTNSVASFLLGAQRFIGPSVWIRISAGFGIYNCSKCRSDLTDERRRGPAGGFGAGIDLARFKGLVLGLEVGTINQINRDGLVSTNTLAVGLSFD